jgi:hypothetical protein
MNHVDLEKELFELMDKFDLLVTDWATAKAMHDKTSELKKIKIHVLASASEAKTNAEKERNAYSSKDYRDYINTLFKEDVNFYVLDARKQGIQQRIDVLRSLLSFERTMVNLNQ